MNKRLGCIILAAGGGKRMKSEVLKPLHKIAGRTMIGHVIAAVEELNPDKIVVVVGPDMEQMTEAVKPHQTAVQQTANGTGAAALAAKEHFSNFNGDILVILGDVPLATPEALKRMVDVRRQSPDVGMTFSGVLHENPAMFGRMVLNEDGTLKKIVEFKDASDEEKKIALCWSGVICADGSKLFQWLEQIDSNNAQKEYYITSLPQMALKDNRKTHVVEVPAEEMEGANTRVELAHLEKIMQNRLRKKHMLNGATLIDPDTVYFSTDTVVGQDVTIGPNVFFGSGVKIGNNVEILPCCHIEGAEIMEGAHVGPFARIRPDSKIGKNAKIGNFVEIKNTNVSDGAKAGHLSYLGDTDIGENTNIGAGTITCNYDGFLKYRTKIGKETFIGSNSILIAPVTIGDGTFIGANSAISKDVPDNALGITRAPQINKDNWAFKFRQMKIKEKAKKGSK